MAPKKKKKKKECVTIMVPVQPADDDAKIGTRPKNNFSLHWLYCSSDFIQQ